MDDEHEFGLELPDGRELFARAVGSSDVSMAWVIVHGLGEHSGCYQDFLCRMLDKGHGVLVYDQHGHGRSPGRRGDAASLRLMVDDISTALECAAKRFPSASLMLLGHSMGGNLVLKHLLDRDVEYVDRAIVTNPMILPPNPPTRPQAFAAWATGKVIPWIRFSASIDPTQLTGDVDALETLASDELIHEQLSVRLGSELINQGIWLLDHAQRLRRPMLVLTGSEDDLCDRETTVQFVTKAGTMCRHIDFNGLRHALLLAKDRARVYDKIHDWVNNGTAFADAIT